MTREEIMSMVPGRELDRLVAEKVMGFKSIWFGRNDPNAVWIEEDCRRKFQPSTDISAAWEVVEKITNGEYEFQILKAPYYDNDTWLVTVSKCVQTEDGLTRFFQETVESKTAPEAICKAALIAVTEE